MTVPSPSGVVSTSAPSWAELDAAGKRSRLLAAAGEVFAREGIDAPMPAVAAAAGAGVGSVYRQFPSKEDLVAALAVQRLRTVAQDIAAAIAAEGEPWQRFEALMWGLADRQASDDVVAEAIATVSGQAEVAVLHTHCELELERLMAQAREAGAMRADARPADVRLLLSAVRGARRLDPASWRRMLELGLDGLAGGVR